VAYLWLLWGSKPLKNFLIVDCAPLRNSYRHFHYGHWLNGPGGEFTIVEDYKTTKTQPHLRIKCGLFHYFCSNRSCLQDLPRPIQEMTQLITLEAQLL